MVYNAQMKRKSTPLQRRLAVMAKTTTVPEIAKACGVTRMTIYNWMKGATIPHTTMLAAVAQATGLPIEELV